MASLPWVSSDGNLNRVSTNWIVNRKSDLLWFIGGALAGYALFFMHSGFNLDMVTIWFLWIIFLDTPHFFGTYVRTYFDKEEWHNRKKLLIGSFAWLLVGPATIGLSYLLFQSGIGNYTLPFFIFIIFFNLWAYWHVVRQHFGIMSLYKKKNNDYDTVDTRADKWILYGGLLGPFAAFLVRHPEVRDRLGLGGVMPEYPSLAEGGFLAQIEGIFTANFWVQVHWEHIIIALSVLLFSTVILFFVYRQFYRWRAGLPINLPKILFLIALIPLYALICYSPFVLTAPLLAFSAFVTIYHDVQYHAIVWFYSQNRYHRPGVDPKKYGLAVKISKNFATYMLSGIAMAALFRLFGCTFEIHPGCGPLVLTSTSELFSGFTSKELILSFMLGFSMHHYFVDQFIWRPSKDKTLQSDLKLNQQKG